MYVYSMLEVCHSLFFVLFLCVRACVRMCLRACVRACACPYPSEPHINPSPPG